MFKKYELTRESMTSEDNKVKVYRIKALKDFGNVKKGDLGGFVESEDNLSHFGKCWIDNNAIVCDGAWVSENAKVCGNAFIYDDAEITGNARVYGNSEVSGFETEVGGHARVYGNAKVYDGLIRGKARVHGNAIIYDNIEVAGDAEVIDDISKYIEIA